MRTLLALLIVVFAGCRYTGTYTCERDDQCRSRAAPGTCQLPAGVCSFPDATCPMGQRYDDTAGDVAGECVGSMSMTDAGPPFDTSVCPSGFTQVAAGIPSKYRALPATTNFATAMAACDAALPGKTHAAIIDTAAEVMALVPSFGAFGTQFYIGVVQDSAALTPAVGWIHADGTPVAASLWMGTEPNDGNGTEIDHLEQAGVITSDGTFSDIDGHMAVPVLCECDGKPVSPVFQDLVAATSAR